MSEVKKVYTGDEREKPSEKIQSELQFKKDFDDDQRSAVGAGRKYNTSREASETVGPVYINPDTSERPNFADADGEIEIYSSSWDEEQEDYPEGAFMTWNSRDDEPGYEMEPSTDTFEMFFSSDKVMTDGGAVIGTERYEPANEYEIDDPTDQIWWEESSEGEPSDAFYNVLENVGDETLVRERQDEFIKRSQALDGQEVQAIENAVENSYDERSHFIEDVQKSDVHPQQTMQITRTVENGNYTPNDFSKYDGFPVKNEDIVNKEVRADGGRFYTGKSTEETTGLDAEYVLGM